MVRQRPVAARAGVQGAQAEARVEPGGDQQLGDPGGVLGEEDAGAEEVAEVAGDRVDRAPGRVERDRRVAAVGVVDPERLREARLQRRRRLARLVERSRAARAGRPGVPPLRGPGGAGAPDRRPRGGAIGRSGALRGELLPHAARRCVLEPRRRASRRVHRSDDPARGHDPRLTRSYRRTWAGRSPDLAVPRRPSWAARPAEAAHADRAARAARVSRSACVQRISIRPCGAARPACGSAAATPRGTPGRRGSTPPGGSRSLRAGRRGRRAARSRGSPRGCGRRSPRTEPCRRRRRG